MLWFALMILACAGCGRSVLKGGPDEIASVRKMVDTLKSPAEFTLPEEDADAYWDEKRSSVRSVERSSGKKYPWCDDPDYVALRRMKISEMSEVQYDLYRALHEKCADASEGDTAYNTDECADPRLRELRSWPLRDLSPREYEYYMDLRDECLERQKKSGVATDPCADAVYSALLNVPLLKMSPNEYDYFIKTWEQCAEETKKRKGRPYDFCGDSLYRAVRLKQIEDMTDQELDFFLRCRRECIRSLIENGHEYNLALDQRYKAALQKAKNRKQRAFIEDVEKENKRRATNNSASGGVAAAAGIVPPVVIVVVLVVVLFFVHLF